MQILSFLITVTYKNSAVASVIDLNHFPQAIHSQGDQNNASSPNAPLEPDWMFLQIDGSLFVLEWNGRQEIGAASHGHHSLHSCASQALFVAEVPAVRRIEDTQDV